MHLKIADYLLKFLFGTFCSLVYIIYLPFCVPVLLWRYIVHNLIAPWYHPGVGHPVAYSSHAFAAEFYGKKAPFTSRFATATCTVMEGSIPNERWKRLVQSKWIDSTVKCDGVIQYKYPELQHYPEEFFGFMYWKLDRFFNIKNHVIFHELDVNGNGKDSKKVMDDLMETLLNRPYNPKRSPWELHIIQNFRDPELVNDTKEDRMTALILRSHHCLADGVSVLKLFMEDLFELDVSKAKIAKPKRLENPSISGNPKLMERVIKWIVAPVKTMYDLGYALYPRIQNNVPYHTPDEVKTGKHFYCRTPLIPVEKVRLIKNKFGVNFNAVLLSAVSAALAGVYKEQGGNARKGGVLPSGITVPLPNHPRNLENHFAGVPFDLPLELDIDPVKRLQLIDGSLTWAKDSIFIAIFQYLRNSFCFTWAPLAAAWAKNHVFSVFLTVFPGPSDDVIWEGRKFLSVHFAIVPLTGVAGFGITMPSFRNHIQIGITAEAAVISGPEMTSLNQRIQDELKKLYEIALN